MEQGGESAAGRGCAFGVQVELACCVAAGVDLEPVAQSFDGGDIQFGSKNAVLATLEGAGDAEGGCRAGDAFGERELADIEIVQLNAPATAACAFARVGLGPAADTDIACAGEIEFHLAREQRARRPFQADIIRLQPDPLAVSDREMVEVHAIEGIARQALCRNCPEAANLAPVDLRQDESASAIAVDPEAGAKDDDQKQGHDAARA